LATTEFSSTTTRHKKVTISASRRSHRWGRQYTRALSLALAAGLGVHRPGTMLEPPRGAGGKLKGAAHPWLPGRSSVPAFFLSFQRSHFCRPRSVHLSGIRPHKSPTRSAPRKKMTSPANALYSRPDEIRQDPTDRHPVTARLSVCEVLGSFPG